MSAVFDAYAAYYDLLYGDKNYVAEADYLHALIGEFLPGPRSIEPRRWRLAGWG